MGARLYYAMAQDNLFFASVGRLNRRGVPAVGLILQGIWSVVLIFSGTYDELLDYVIFASLLFYVLTVVGLFILRWRAPDLPRPYRVLRLSGDAGDLRASCVRSSCSTCCSSSRCIPGRA